MTADWTDLYRDFAPNAAFLHIDHYDQGAIVGIHWRKDTAQVVEGDPLFAQKLRDVVRGYPKTCLSSRREQLR